MQVGIDVVNDYLLCLAIKATAQPPDNAPSRQCPGRVGGHTHLLGRDLSPLEVSEGILARCLHLPQEVSGDLAQELRGFGWL